MARKIPLNFFGMPFGLAGLGEAWFVASHKGHVPPAVGDAFFALSALVWVIVVAAYLRYVLSHRGAFRADLLDPVAAPFMSLAVIVPMLFGALAIAPHWPMAGKVVALTFLGLTVLSGAWFTGQWIYGPLELDKLHPGYFLPTVAGGFVAAAAAAEVGERLLGQVMLGFGVICWLMLGSMILGRLFFRPFLPAAIVPTLAIEVAPAAVASLAYFAINGGRVDAIAAAIAGYGLLMVLAQIRLLPAYLRLKFTSSFWAFSFSWATVGATAIQWIDARGAHHSFVYATLAAVTLLIGGIGLRTLLALSRRQLLPPT